MRAYEKMREEGREDEEEVRQGEVREEEVREEEEEVRGGEEEKAVTYREGGRRGEEDKMIM